LWFLPCLRFRAKGPFVPIAWATAQRRPGNGPKKFNPRANGPTVPRFIIGDDNPFGITGRPSAPSTPNTANTWCCRLSGPLGRNGPTVFVFPAPRPASVSVVPGHRPIRSHSLGHSAAAARETPPKKIIPRANGPAVPRFIIGDDHPSGITRRPLRTSAPSTPNTTTSWCSLSFHGSVPRSTGAATTPERLARWAVTVPVSVFPGQRPIRSYSLGHSAAAARETAPKKSSPGPTARPFRDSSSATIIRLASRRPLRTSAHRHQTPNLLVFSFVSRIRTAFNRCRTITPERLARWAETPFILGAPYLARRSALGQAMGTAGPWGRNRIQSHT
jgi:hypothetical protein